MQYILTEAELKALSKAEDKVNDLIKILTEISTENVSNLEKLKLFDTLSRDLNFANKNGILNATIYSWANRKSEEI